MCCEINSLEDGTKRTSPRGGACAAPRGGCPAPDGRCLPQVPAGRHLVLIRRGPFGSRPRTLTRVIMAGPEFIYVMKALTKVVPPNRVILKDIWLSFYPGAKIGVVGANGSGKSSLLRVMAGLDRDFNGEAWAAQGTRVGYLPQEPQLDPALDVRGNVEEAVRHQRDLLRRFEE